MGSQKPLVATVAIVWLAAVVLVTVGCSDDSTIRVSGRVADDVLIVQAPSLLSPRPAIDAGFPASDSQGGSAGTAGRSAPSTISALTGLGSVSRIATVAVLPGDTVSAGDVITAFDAAALEANVAVARADERVARAQVEVVSDAISEADSADSTLAANRRRLSATIAQLATTRVQLAGRLAQLKALLAQLEATMRASSGASGGLGGGPSLPGTSTTNTPPGARPVTPTPAQVRGMIAELETALAQIDIGLARARRGRSQLASAKSTLDDARAQLSALRRVARIAADASSIGVRAAEYQRSLAVVRAPVAGVILQVARVGDVLAPGATVARIREPRAPRILTWLPPRDLHRIAAGDRVRITGDWFSAAVPVAGRITRIGERSDYPPTSFATKDVHMTRAVPVEITVERTAPDGRPSSDDALPPGTPVDVTILPRSSTRD